MANGKRHTAEAELLRFLERQDQTADYVRRTADWIREHYPGSWPTMRPRLRAIYKAKLNNPAG